MWLNSVLILQSRFVQFLSRELEPPPSHQTDHPGAHVDQYGPCAGALNADSPKSKKASTIPN